MKKSLIFLIFLLLPLVAEAEKAITILDVKANCFDLKDKIIKLKFFARGNIHQIDENKYSTMLYYYAAHIRVEFDQSALKWMKRLPCPKVNQYGIPNIKMKRYYYVFGRVILEDKNPILILIGRTPHKDISGKIIKYTW